MKSCDELVETLSAFVDGEESHTEAVGARAHLETCPACRSMVEDWRRIETIIPFEDLDAPVVTAANAARRRRVAPAWRALLAAAIVSLAGVGGGALVVSSRDDGPSGPGVAPPAPIESRPALVREPRDKPKPAPAPSERNDGGSGSGEGATIPGAARGTNGELTMSMKLERTDPVAGRPFSVAVSLRNPTDHDVEFRAPVESPIDVVIADRSGKIVSRRSDRWSDRYAIRTLKPGESIREQIVMTAPVVPGTYAARAECVCHAPEQLGRPAPSDPSVMTFPDDRGSKVSPFSTGDVRLTVRRS